jgi:hypothetical protein
MKRTGALILAFLISLSVLPGCGLFSSGGSTTASGSPLPPAVLKPKPSVVEVNATTSGQADYYYAILETALKNDGADGTVLLTITITQGANVQTREVPVFLTKNTREALRLVFPLKWKGGDWTPAVKVEVP